VFGLLLAGDHSVGTPCTNLVNLLNIALAYNSKGTGFFPCGKAAGVQLVAELRMSGIYFPLPVECLHGVGRESNPFHLYCKLFERLWLLKK